MAKRSETGPGPEADPQDQVSVADVERLLAGIPGVDRAKVVVNDWGSIESIHVMGDTSRPAKRVVRDIESALAADLGILVDRRKISLAQVRTAGASKHAPGPQLVLGSYSIEADALTRRTFVRVNLVGGDDPQHRYEGAAEAGAGEGNAEDALVRATLRALEQALPTDVHVFPAGSRRLVEGPGNVWLSLVRVVRDGLGESVHAGAAVEGSAPPESVVHATLAAVADVVLRTGLRTVDDADPESVSEEDDFA